jgi:hypothetical protein
MDPQANPFAALSLIAAPAVLTNASSVLALGTSNRLARAVDYARQLTTQLEQQNTLDSPSTGVRSRELEAVQRRMLMLIRALSAFYVAIGSFASAALISLIGAVLTPTVPALAAKAIESLAVCVGAVAVGALVRGAFLLVRETRVAVGTMEDRVAQVQLKIARLQEEATKTASVEQAL